jgi:predicted RNA methylase
MPRSRIIDADILAILAALECEGDLAHQYPAQLDRPVYSRLNKVLTDLGGKWNRKRKGHVFASGDAAAALDDAVAFGEYTDAKQVFQNFPTPPPFAAHLVDLLGITNGEPVLEPSCGEGNIVDALGNAGCGNIFAVEIRPECIEGIQAKPGVNKVVCEDFLQMHFLQMHADDPCFAGAAMNPPFTNGQDIAHVQHAFEFIRPGGRLVAVLSSSFTFRKQRRFVEFRDWAKSVGATWTQNPEGTFRPSGTNVSTVTLEVTKE